LAYTTTAGTLVDRTRRWMIDTPDYDTITAAFTDTTGTTMTVADTTAYNKRWVIEVDYETMIIRSITNATTMVVSRGAYGSTAATHANGTRVLVRPAFLAQEILEALNQAVMEMYPRVYKPINDTSITTTDSTYEYAVPNAPDTYEGNSIQIPWVYKVEAKYAGDLTYRELTRWGIEKGNITGSLANQKLLKFRSAEPGGASLRVQGAAPFPTFTGTGSVIDPMFPPQAIPILPMFAAAYLLMSGESGRDRYDTGTTDRREEAQRAGSSLQTGVQVWQRAQLALDRAALPPLPRKLKKII